LTASLTATPIIVRLTLAMGGDAVDTGAAGEGPRGVVAARVT